VICDLRLIPVVALVAALAAGCSNNRLTAEDAQRLIEASPRFAAPDVVTVRSQYCSTIDAPTESVTAGVGRLKALESAGAIKIQRRAAAPNECTSLPAPLRERLLISLGESSSSFHPRALENNAGWEFPLGRRRFVSLGELSFDSDDDPKIAHVVYKWAWKAELLGQLLQTSEEPVNAQATFVRPGSEWRLRDVGF
jgi:hypothetical protein